ncbi:MAG: apolipoprotein N-acyltransferase [Deltaproteobacteria bacterium]|nr:apolipoprotein N-acyltransferase [Deltaproteobacteria bacterium]
MNKKDLLFSLLSGLLVCLSFPKADLGLLIWIALVPLLYAIRDTDLPGAFRTGFVAGLVYNTGLVYWIVFVAVRYGHLPLYAGVSVMLLLVMYLSLYPALFCVGVVYFRKRGIRAVLMAPLLWTSLEYLKAHLFSGFPWEDLAYSQHGHLSLIQIADITGVYGITFLIVLLNCILYDCMSGLFPAPGGKRRLPFPEIIAGVALILLVFGYGIYRIDTLKGAEEGLDSVNVLLVQGNIDQSVKWSPQFQTETMDIYRQLSADASGRGVSLIVWPETAAPFYFQNYDERSRGVIDVVRQTGAWLLFGSPAYDREGKDISFHNSAYLLAPDGSVSGRYDKVHLVPFGEYVPLRRILFFIDKLVIGAGDFKPGGEIAPLPMGDNKIGTLICYEGIFPEIAREYRLKGAGLLVNITNDAWYGNTSAPYQHLTMGIFRAIENRTYMIRAANTGISAIVNTAGRIVSRTDLFERKTLSGTVKFTHHRTFYSRYGNVFACFCIGFLLIGSLVCLRRKNR